MRVLLDTNIIIHRENSIVTNYSIGQLYHWLDKLHYDKVIHPFTIEELNRYQDEEKQKLLAVKLQAYQVLHSTRQPDQSFIEQTGQEEKDTNDHIDNCLLYELYNNRVDFLITEDRRLRNKAIALGISDRVFSINDFITWATDGNPELIDYDALSVELVHFGDLDVKNPFFNSFINDYVGFEQWFSGKTDEEAYICRSDDSILGFLYLKTENETENYHDISPVFQPKKRLKVGTFKVETTGFRLGERFIKIIVDNAIARNVDEVYVTLFDNRPELLALIDLLDVWGFTYHGIKSGESGQEQVYVKDMHCFDPSLSVMQNYPLIKRDSRKYIIPIFPQFHTTLFPDSILTTEKKLDYIEHKAHRYALKKVYVGKAYNPDARPGDILLFYRTGEYGTNKKYTSTITTVGIVDEVLTGFQNEADFLDCCQNRSVFSEEELRSFWRSFGTSCVVIKFIYLKSLNKKPILGFLWENGIVNPPSGPRPFHQLTDEQFTMILDQAETELSFFNG